MLQQSDFSERYATLNDAELLAISDENANLVEAAKMALQSELARRGLHGSTLKQYQVEAEQRFDSDLLSQAPVRQGRWIDLAIPNRALTFPSLCPACLKSNPDSCVSIGSEQRHFAGYRILYSKYRYLRVAVPHCGNCARTFLFWQRISRLSIACGMLLAVFVAVKFNLHAWLVWALAVPFCGPGIWASTYLKRSVRLVYFDEKWLTFRLRSMEYAEQFKALNSD